MNTGKSEVAWRLEQIRLQALILTIEGEHINMEQLWKRLRWSASGHCWFAKTDEVLIFVSEETYEQHLKVYLAERGIELKAWTEYMRPAEEAWKRQCEAISTFQANLDYWLTCNKRGVEIHQRTNEVKR